MAMRSTRESGRVGSGRAICDGAGLLAVKISTRYKAAPLEKLFFGILDGFSAAHLGWEGIKRDEEAELIVWHGTLKPVCVFSVCRVSPFVSCEKRR